MKLEYTAYGTRNLNIQPMVHEIGIRNLVHETRTRNL